MVDRDKRDELIEHLARTFIQVRKIIEEVPLENRFEKMLELEPTVPETDTEAYELAERYVDTLDRHMPSYDMYRTIIKEEQRRHTNEAGELDRKAYKLAVRNRTMDLTALSANLEAALDDNEED